MLQLRRLYNQHRVRWKFVSGDQVGLKVLKENGCGLF